MSHHHLTFMYALQQKKETTRMGVKDTSYVWGQKQQKKSNYWTFLVVIFCSHTINLTKLFWIVVHRGKKCRDIKKVTSGGRAENENLNVCHSFHVFNFSSATRRHCWILTTLLHLWTTWSQKTVLKWHINRIIRQDLEELLI